MFRIKLRIVQVGLIKKNMIEQIKKDIAEFEVYMKKVDKKQLNYPLDALSQQVIHKDLPVPTGGIAVPYSLVTFNRALDVEVNGKHYYILTTTEY